MSNAMTARGPAADTTATTRLILRDGSTAGLRLTSRNDREAIAQFFRELSPASRRRRFLASTEPPPSLIDEFCDNSDPRRAVTLAVLRHYGDEIRLIGVGSYFAEGKEQAEVAFAVDDHFHGKGIATALLERLAAIAADSGFVGFDATVLAENLDMLDVFRDSGFAIRSDTADGCVDVHLSLTPSSDSLSAADERDRTATIASLKPLLEPSAVAVIGASREKSNLGRRVFDALVASGCRVYPVNPGTDELAGLPCYASTRELPAGIDLAVIAVPRDGLLAVIDDCASAGVKGVVVITAGFAENGPEGLALQAQLVERVRCYGMRMVGPNCMGLLNTRKDAPFNASFAERLPAAGRIALASQSGGLGLAILELAHRRQIGLSTFVSLGNKADVSGNDLLQYAESDPATSVILLYLESFGNPGRFAHLARRISRKKPIIVVKSGRTPAGTRAAASHTAGLAASELAIDGLFRQSGVIRADTIDEMFDVAALLDAQPLPNGTRTAIITNAGGPGILAADACATAGLRLDEFVPATRSVLATFLPSVASINNPIDMVASASPDDYRKTLETLLAADDVDAVIVIYTTIDPARTTETLQAIQDGVVSGRGAGHTAKPVLVCTMASATAAALPAGTERLPVYPFPEQAVRALGKAAAYADWVSEPVGGYRNFGAAQAHEARMFCRDIVQTRGTTWLSIDELRQLLDMVGLHVVPGVLAATADEAVTMARLVGFPVAVKMASPKAVHKTELGGVRLNLTDERGVRSAFLEISAAFKASLGEDLDGVIVQPMLTNGVETIVGLTSDSTFGPLVAFGLGGVNVEVFRDVAFRIAPLTDRDADDLLRSIRGWPLLVGHRGRVPVDLTALRDLLLRVAYLGSQVPELLELDFNPVMALPRGCEVVDARVRVGPLPR